MVLIPCARPPLQSRSRAGEGRRAGVMAAAAGPVAVLLLVALALPALHAAVAAAGSEAGPPHHHPAELGCPSTLFLRGQHSPAATLGVEQIGAWAESSPTFAGYAPVLREQQLDAIALSLATAEGLALRLPLGVALKLKRCFDELLESDLIDHLEDALHDDDQAAHEQTELDVFLRELPTAAQEGWQRRRTQQGGPADHAAAICNADINHNGEVDTADLLLVLGGFGGQCDAPAQPAGGDGGLCACSGELAQMIASLRRLQSGAAPEPEPDATRPPRPPRPIQPAPAPQDASCADMQTWVSSVDKVGCSQYGPGPTSWQSMCAAHVGYDLSEDGGQPGSIERVTPITAAAACPASCGLCPSCADNRQNGDETGIDCGGASCDPCVPMNFCGPIESSGLVGANLDAICTGQALGDTCFTQPSRGYRPSTPAAAAEQCGVGSDCAAQLASMFMVPAAGVQPGHFVCTANGLWQGEQLPVLRILPTVCPAQVRGNHYSANCAASDTCVAQCDPGYPATRGDGTFICRGGTWIGDLVCEPITCGLTLDKMPAETSAFSVCTGGDTLGSDCTAFCREGYFQLSALVLARSSVWMRLVDCGCSKASRPGGSHRYSAHDVRRLRIAKCHRVPPVRTHSAPLVLTDSTATVTTKRRPDACQRQ
eukprot:COSAG06_NODE_3576_length_5164_cov_2.017173_3_plen_655_part_00